MPPLIKVGDQDVLVDTKDFPLAKFPFEKFNPVQSRVFEFYDKDANAIIAAATSAGKTVMAEMLAAYQLRVKKKKVIYLAPMKSLAKEKYDDWTDSRHHFGDLKVSICTGDYRLTPERKKELDAADIIILTNEMLSSRTRNMASEKNEWLKQVGAVIADESHLLGVPGRGDHAEVGMMSFTKLNPEARLILLSATIPNVEQIAEWVSYSLTKRETYLLVSKYRPCPLGVHYETHDTIGGYDQVEKNKVEIALDIMSEHPDDKFLLFVHTKRTGEMLKTAIKAKFKKHVEFHSADLGKSDREELEARFKSREPDSLQYLVATSTLAWGCYEQDTLVSMANGTTKKISDVEIGDNVYGFNGSDFESCKVLNVTSMRADKSLEFRLESGEIFEVGSNHEFYGTSGRNKPGYVLANTLNVGDFIAVPSKFNKFRDVLADDQGYLMGYMMGDGCKCLCGEHADGEAKIQMDISFGSDEVNHVEYLRELFTKTYGYSFGKTSIDNNGVLHLVSKQRELVSNFKCLPVGRNKEHLTFSLLPRHDSSYLRGVLQGLFDTDGGFSSHGNGNFSIEFTSISKRLCQEVQQLLLNFGIRSSLGRKKMKSSKIKGRLQVAKREWIHRVRIYHEQIETFLKQIGFRNIHKHGYGEYFLNNKKTGVEKDLIPCRELILDHAVANNISASKLLKEVGCCKWTTLNKQELSRATCLKLIKSHPNDSEFKLLVGSDLRFSKIKEIKEIVKPRQMWDLEVDKFNNFVGNGVLSHNCNMPARRVIILGVHRGVSEVETYDIVQMQGRAGRVGFDPRGDVYILLPENREEYHRNRLRNQANIESRLLDNLNGHYKTLAFHLVSEIHHGRIKTIDDVHEWYSRTLACFQSQDLDDSIAKSTLDLLMRFGAIKEDDGVYRVTVVGMVASMFYYSPFDVADLRKNFMNLFKNNQQDDDISVALALGNVDSIRLGIVSRAEREDMGLFSAKVKKQFVLESANFNDAAIKGSFAYWCAMTGGNPGSVGAYAKSLQWDVPRLIQVLQGLDTLGCKWNKTEYFKDLQNRIFYGVEAHLIDFVKLPDIGKVRAERLYSVGFRNISDIVADPEKVRVALNMKADKVLDIVAAAKGLMLMGSS